jgi:hypothetical protein
MSCQEGFNNRRSKIALYENPNSCPFDYINFDEYENDNQSKYVVKSKLKTSAEPELENVFDSTNEFQQAWDTVEAIFPNLNRCGNPYKNYLLKLRKKYIDQQYMPYTTETTAPIYNLEYFQAPTQTWRTVASEGQNFNVNGTQQIRYGVDSRWVQRSLSGNVMCNNAMFGDPAPGTRKQCDQSTPASVPVPPAVVRVPTQPAVQSGPTILANSVPATVLNPTTPYTLQSPWKNVGGVAQGLDPSTKWIWYGGNLSPGVNGPILFQAQIMNNTPTPMPAQVKLLVDNFANVYLMTPSQTLQLVSPATGQQIQTSKGQFKTSFGGWNRVSTQIITLQPGNNIVVIGGFNAGSGTNPAGLAANITDMSGRVLPGGISNSTWLVSLALPPIVSTLPTTVPAQPAMVVPAQPAKVVPAQPAKVVPAQPAMVVPAQPAKVVPAQPAKVVPAQPAKVVPAQPAKVVPAQPAKVVPAQPAQPAKVVPPQPAQPAQVIPAQPAKTIPAQPAQPARVIPAQPAQPAKMVPAQPAQPAKVVPAQPERVIPAMGTLPAQVIPAQPAKLIPAQPAQPARVIPAQPAQATKVVPAQPAKPAQVIPAQATKVIPAQPAQPAKVIPAQPAKPATLIPAKPATVIPAQAAKVIPAQPAKVIPVQAAKVIPAQAAKVIPAQPAKVIPAQAAKVIPAQPAKVIPAQPAKVITAQPGKVIPKPMTVPKLPITGLPRPVDSVQMGRSSFYDQPLQTLEQAIQAALQALIDQQRTLQTLKSKYPSSSTTVMFPKVPVAGATRPVVTGAPIAVVPSRPLIQGFQSAIAPTVARVAPVAVVTTATQQAVVAQQQAVKAQQQAFKALQDLQNQQTGTPERAIAAQQTAISAQREAVDALIALQIPSQQRQLSPQQRFLNQTIKAQQDALKLQQQALTALSGPTPIVPVVKPMQAVVPSKPVVPRAPIIPAVAPLVPAVAPLVPAVAIRQQTGPIVPPAPLSPQSFEDQYRRQQQALQVQQQALQSQQRALQVQQQALQSEQGLRQAQRQRQVVRPVQPVRQVVPVQPRPQQQSVILDIKPLRIQLEGPVSGARIEPQAVVRPVTVVPPVAVLPPLSRQLPNQRTPNVVTSMATNVGLINGPAPAVLRVTTPVSRVDLPAIYSDRNLPIRKLTRDEHNPSQLSPRAFATPNVPQLDQNSQIDTSVEVANVKIPPTYSEQQLQNMKVGSLDANFDRQREQQKIVLQSSNEIERLKREIDGLREELIYQKEHFENMNSSVGDKQQQIESVYDLNDQLHQKVAELEKKNDVYKNLYDLTDSQRNTYEVRLNAIQRARIEERRNKGFTYLPPENWTLNQWRPPVCLPQKEFPVVASLSSPTMGDYMTVFDQSATGSVLPKFKYEVIKNEKYYLPTPADKAKETLTRSVREVQVNQDLKTDFIDPTDYPHRGQVNANSLPYTPLIKNENTIVDSNGYRP